MSVRILTGDCRSVLKTLPDASVDSIVTDPPYELTGKRPGGRSPATEGKVMKGFMGMKWDGSGVAFDVDVWLECLRVLKPGGHLLAFSGTCTQHRMVCAIEDAGFEIRDQAGWMYGSGFPKSLDVSKAIDKMGGASVAWFGPWFRSWREQNDVTQKQVAALFPSKTGGLTGCVANWELGLNMPTIEQFNRIRDAFGLPFDSIEAVQREVIGQQTQSLLAVAPGQGSDRSATVLNITAPATDAAHQWQGWGTALKPAWEPICVARKPLIGTVAANVLAHGTGALNIDGCRVPSEAPRDWREARRNVESDEARNTFGKGLAGSMAVEDTSLGRWPANLMHDGSDEVLAVFPDSNGQQGFVGERNGDRPSINTFGDYGVRPDHPPRGDTGSAARFFYTAKATAHDRNDGTYDLQQVVVNITEGHGRGAMNTSKGDGTGERVNKPRGNHHPTVKPTELMRYLCRLVTPPGGTVLDPFMGSGSTLKAAELEGFSAIGIELDPAYVAIAQRRIASDAPLFAEVTA